MTYTTSISLDPEAAALETRMKQEGKNFSAFVRECLFIYYREEHQECRGEGMESWLGCEPFCNPTQRHHCRACWPDGQPTTADLGRARRHVNQCVSCRADKSHLVKQENLIEGHFESEPGGLLRFSEEPKILEWLQERAMRSNRFVGSLAGMEIPSKSKPAKAEKPRKSLFKRLLREIAQ